METPHLMMLIAAPPEAARALARSLVEEAAAACVQITAPVASVYHWEGAVHEESEVLLFVKTNAAKRGEVRRLVAARHPYRVPELIEIPICGGSGAYLRWIDETVNRKTT